MTTPHPVLFDLDGTLIDSIDLIVDSFLHVFDTHQLAAPSRETIIDGIGTPLWKVFGGLSDDQAEITRWIATYREYNLRHHDQRVRAFPGIEAMLRTVHGTGRPLGIVTSKNHAGAERGLKLIGVRELFEVIVGADDVTDPKPHPEPVRRALTHLGAEAANAWYIGDSHHDIASGNAAGTRTIGVTWGPISRERLMATSPTRLADTPDQILEHLGVPLPVLGRR